MFKIAVIGGSGPQGKALALRFARAGHSVTLGSRSAERARDAAAEVNARLDADGPAAGSAGDAAPVDAAENLTAAQQAQVVLLAVPYQGHAELVSSLADGLGGKTVISCVNPLGFDQQGPFGLDMAESAAEEAQRLVPDAVVVGAFHHVSALNLWRADGLLEHEDVLVCGDSAEAKAVVVELARAVTGRDGIDAGRLRLARQLEPLTAVLISINKRYKVRSGIRVSGLPH